MPRKSVNGCESNHVFGDSAFAPSASPAAAAAPLFPARLTVRRLRPTRPINFSDFSRVLFVAPRLFEVSAINHNPLS